MIKPAKTFQDLIVWQKAHQLVLSIYSITANFPKSEVYGLASQLRRAAISIPANIAEGFRKRGKADKARFLNIAQGSLAETHYYILLAKDLDYIDNIKLLLQLDEISKLLEAYSKSILNSNS